jgi:hypothetical protein
MLQAATTAADNAFNASIFKVKPTAGANRLRRRLAFSSSTDFNVPW